MPFAETMIGLQAPKKKTFLSQNTWQIVFLTLNAYIIYQKGIKTLRYLYLS